MANISAAASVLFYAYLSALGFFCPFRLTFHFQNTVDVLLDNVVFLDLLFQFSIVGIQGFFLFLKCCVLYLQGGNAWELGDTRCLDCLCRCFMENYIALMGCPVFILILCLAVCSIGRLATTVGVLTEVPVMLLLVRIANKTKGRFPA